MTRKKDKKDGQIKDQKKEVESEDLKEKEKTKLKINEEKSEMEPKLIEKKEDALPKLIEYFSKEELIKKVKELEKLVNDNNKKIKNLSEWKDKYTRLQAEFENSQKRWEKNRQDLRIQYTASILKNFLPLYDSFKKAIEIDPENNSLAQFFNQFLNILKSNNTEKIEVKISDPFDYHIHEALTVIEKEDLPNNSIVEIVQDGWKINKEVLRHAKVIISRKPKPSEPEPQSEELKSNEEEIKDEHKNQEDN